MILYVPLIPSCEPLLNFFWIRPCHQATWQYSALVRLSFKMHRDVKMTQIGSPKYGLSDRQKIQSYLEITHVKTFCFGLVKNVMPLWRYFLQHNTKAYMQRHTDTRNSYSAMKTNLVTIQHVKKLRYSDDFKLRIKQTVTIYHSITRRTSNLGVSVS